MKLKTFSKNNDDDDHDEVDVHQKLLLIYLCLFFLKVGWDSSS